MGGPSIGTVPAELGFQRLSQKNRNMKRIKAVISCSSLDDFHQCVRQLGIFGFDLSHERGRRGNRNQGPATNFTSAKSRFEVDFAVLDEEAKPTVHAVLESAHPDSVRIFKLEQETQPARQRRPA